MNRRNPTVAATLDRLNKYRIVGGITQCVSQSADRAADALVEIHENIFRPERLPKVFAAYHLAGTAQQNRQGAKR